MRWVAVALAFVALWVAYLASPYWALYQLATAISQGNVREVEARVNLRALKVALARQLTDDLAALDKTGTIGSADIHFATATALVYADPFLDALMTPDGLVRLLRPDRVAPGPNEAGSPFVRGLSLDEVGDLLAASTWRGFRNIYFGLPTERPVAERFRLQLRISRLSWRLISVELPPTAQRRLAAELLRRVTKSAP